MFTNNSYFRVYFMHCGNYHFLINSNLVGLHGWWENVLFCWYNFKLRN